MSFLGTIETRGQPLPASAAAPVRPLLFLDFEASSLSPESWPIEIGWAWIEDDEVRSASMLIAPRGDWPLSDWSEGAERVHGITLGTVLAGTAAEAVAAASDGFADFELVSDNPAWEQRWLDRLRAGRPRLPVQPLRQAVAARMEPIEADWFRCALIRNTPVHRAGADAALIADAWLAATRGDLLAA